MDHQEYLHETYFGGEAMDASEFERMAALFAGVELFVDVGASHGVYTYHATQHLVGGRIVAIEADPERFAILEANAEKWRSDSAAAIECTFAAATDDEDLADGPTATFFTTGTQISGGLFPVDERSDAYAPIEVPRIRLDDIADTGVKTLVKIDVEGGELRVLKGSRALIDSGNASFFVELSWWGDRDRKTSVFTTLRHIYSAGLGIERRLRSDYLLTPEPDAKQRLLQVAKVVPALLPRYLFATFAPFPLRRRMIRKQNAQRLARVYEAAGESVPDESTVGEPPAR